MKEDLLKKRQAAEIEIRKHESMILRYQGAIAMIDQLIAEEESKEEAKDADVQV